MIVTDEASVIANKLWIQLNNTYIVARFALFVKIWGYLVLVFVSLLATRHFEAQDEWRGYSFATRASVFVIKLCSSDAELIVAG